MYIITGTGGKVGKALKDRLEKKKKLLLVLKYTSNKKIFLLKKKKFEYFLICNYFDFKNLNKILKINNKFKGIIHLGWSGVSEPRRKKIHEKNYINSKRFFNFFYNSKRISFFIFFGSIDQYGDSQRKIYETDNLKYSKIERSYEFYKQKFSSYLHKKNNKISAITIILSNVIGKPHKSKSIIGYFKKCLRNKTIPIVNKNKFYRNFILSEDVARYMEKILTNNKNNQNLIVNLGNHQSFRVDLFYGSLWKKMSKGLNINYHKEKIKNIDYKRNKFFLNINELKYMTKLNLSKTKSQLINKTLSNI